MTPSLAQVLRHQTLIDEPLSKTVKQTGILYTNPILKSNFKSKNFDIAKTKLPWRKHKKDIDNTNKRKSGHANIKRSNMPRRSDNTTTTA